MYHAINLVRHSFCFCASCPCLTVDADRVFFFCVRLAWAFIRHTRALQYALRNTCRNRARKRRMRHKRPQHASRPTPKSSFQGQTKPSHSIRSTTSSGVCITLNLYIALTNVAPSRGGSNSHSRKTANGERPSDQIEEYSEPVRPYAPRPAPAPSHQADG